MQTGVWKERKVPFFLLFLHTPGRHQVEGLIEREREPGPSASATHHQFSRYREGSQLKRTPLSLSLSPFLCACWEETSFCFVFVELKYKEKRARTRLLWNNNNKKCVVVLLFVLLFISKVSKCDQSLLFFVVKLCALMAAVINSIWIHQSPINCIEKSYSSYQKNGKSSKSWLKGSFLLYVTHTHT